MLVAAWSFLSVSAAHASEPQPNAEFPIRIEDATVTESGKFQTYLPARYLHLDDGTDQLQLLPEIDYGFGEVFEFDVKVPVLMGDADDTNSGDVQLALQWQAVQQSEEFDFATISLEGQITLPTGEDSAGLDTQFTLLVTKQLGGDDTKGSVHLNASWIRNAANGDDERENRGLLVLGYSRLLSKDTLLVADVAREWDEAEDVESNLVEVGVIQAINDKLKLAAGVGTGIGDESPHLTATVGLEYDF